MTQKRHKTMGVKVGNVQVGGGAPIVVQSMTNTDTADIASTAQQCFELAQAGSELGAHHRERAGGGEVGKSKLPAPDRSLRFAPSELWRYCSREPIRYGFAVCTSRIKNLRLRHA